MLGCQTFTSEAGKPHPTLHISYQLLRVEKKGSKLNKGQHQKTFVYFAYQKITFIRLMLFLVVQPHSFGATALDRCNVVEGKHS